MDLPMTFHTRYDAPMGVTTTSHRRGERGVALLSAILVLMLMSAMLVGFVAIVNSDQTSSGIGRDQTQSYAAAHAGLEKLTADLGTLFTTNYAPTGAAVDALEAAPPTIPGITFINPSGGSGYQISFTDANNNGFPDAEDEVNGSDITSGPFAGLKGIITRYAVDVTARTTGGSEVRMRREMQSVGIPVFQFGIFSESDQSFHAGEDFYFAGRVHSNSNVFLASADSTTLTLGDRVTAVGEVVRRRYVNGRTSTHNGTVNMARGAGCTPTVTANCRALAEAEASVLDGLSPLDPRPGWTATSVTTYQQWIRDGTTGAKRLDLPLVSDGAEAIDLIRRGRPTDTPAVAAQRFYGMASLRVLLADTAAELTSLPGAVGTPISLEALALPGGAGSHTLGGAGTAANGYRSAVNTPLIGGYILINKLSNAATPAYSDVTPQVLAQGITGNKLTTACATAQYHANAIIRLQRLSDSANCATGLTTTTSLWPNSLYDPREGVRREEATKIADVYLGGVMYYVELDVNNLRRWFMDNTFAGAVGNGSQNVTGYVFYFSDRRTNNDGTSSTGEYGWEDTVNDDAQGTPDNSADAGEDANNDSVHQLYGATPRLATFNPNAAPAPYTGALRPHHSTTATIAKSNRAVFFRRALKLVNGALGQLPFNGPQGLTVASENPVYIQGHFNACNNTPTASSCINANGFVDGAGTNIHKSASVVADSVTVLSRSWNDNNSYNNPHITTNRQASDTWYRLGIIAGKTRTFPWISGAFANFGSDGGAHNFLRMMEDWEDNFINYRGSMISLFYSRQATGNWKYGTRTVYYAPERNSLFETEFLTPSLLPPRTPMFRDINTLTFRQVLRPTQQ